MHDARAYATMSAHDLAFADVITYQQVPMLSDNHEVVLHSWPMLLPHTLVLFSVSDMSLFVGGMCAEAQKLLESGYRWLFGHPDEEYWNVLATEFSITKPCESDSCGVHIYGDEANVFDSVQFMALHWTPDLCPLDSDARCSRFLVCLLLTLRYHVEGKTNWTLQHALKRVVASLNHWRSEGVCGLHVAVCGIRGDWKFLCQALNLPPVIRFAFGAGLQSQ